MQSIKNTPLYILSEPLSVRPETRKRQNKSQETRLWRRLNSVSWLSCWQVSDCPSLFAHNSDTSLAALCSCRQSQRRNSCSSRSSSSNNLSVNRHRFHYRTQFHLDWQINFHGTTACVPKRTSSVVLYNAVLTAVMQQVDSDTYACRRRVAIIFSLMPISTQTTPTRRIQRSHRRCIGT